MPASSLPGFAFAATLILAAPAAAQTFRCVGNLNGVPSQSAIQLERTPNTIYVSGMIQNPYAHYSFNGEMFGGNEGYISMVEQRTGERIDRVYIAITQVGYMIRAERSAPHEFECRQ